MGKCSYSITFKDQILDFDSENELDKFIKDNIEEIALGLSSSVNYSLTGNSPQQQSVINKLTEMSSKVIGTNKGLQIDGDIFVGTTRFVDGYRTKAGDRIAPEFILEFWRDNYKAKEINGFLDSLRNGSFPGLNAEESKENRLEPDNNKLINKYKAEYDKFIDIVENKMLTEEQMWSVKASTGTVWHFMAESYFNMRNEGKIPTSEDMRNAVSKFMIESITNLDLQKIIVNNDVVDGFLKYLNELESEIIGRFGKGVKFMTEVKLFNKGDVYVTQSKNGEEKNRKYKGIAGIADLIVVGEDGKVGMYDYKTTGKDYKDWDSGKTVSVNAQQGVYSAILEKLGLNVVDTSILPIIHDDFVKTKDSNGNEFISVSKFHYPTGSKAIPSVFSSLTARAQEAIKSTIKTTGGKLSVSTKIQNTVSALETLFSYESASALKTSTVDEIAEKIIKSNLDLTNYKFYDKIGGSYVKIPIDITKDTKTQLVKALTPYIEAEHSAMKSLPAFIKTFFNKFQESHRNGDPITLQFSQDVWTNNEVAKMLNQYIIDDNWQIVDNSDSEQLGMVLFVNKSTGVLNILNLTTNDIRKPINLENGNTLLGRFLNNAKSKKAGLTEATNADIESFKVYNFIMNNEAAFSAYKIGSIETWQIKQNHQVTNRSTQFLEKIQSDYNAIMSSGFIDDSIKASWNAKIADYGEVAANLLASILESSDERDLLNFQGRKQIKGSLDVMVNYDIMSIEQKRQILITLHDQVLKSYGQIENVQNDKMRRVLNMLAQGIATLNGIELAVQGDYDNFGNIIGNNTLAATNANYLNHPMIQAVRGLVTRGLSSTAYMYQDLIKNKFKVFRKFYESGDAARGLKRVQISGDPVPAFRELMDVDVNGVYTGFLKNPNSPELKPGQKEFIISFAEMIKEVRIKELMNIGKTENEAKIIAQQHYLAIPLIKASVMSAFKSKGIKKAMEAYTDYVLNPNRFYDSTQAQAALSRTQSFVSNSFEFAEPWHADNRQKVLDSQIENPIEEDLELLFNMFAMSTAKSVEMSKVTPIINAVKTLMATSADFQYEDQKNNYKYVLDYVDYVIYGKRNIEKTMEKVEPIIYMMKDVNSMLTLGFNPFQTITEGMPGLIGNIVRSLGNIIDYRYFKPKDLVNAYTLVAGENVNGDTVKLVDEVSRLFRLSDRSLFELVEKQQTGRRGLVNAKGYLGYIFASVPGYWNRLSISIAQMAHDGVLIIKNGKISEDSPMQIIKDELVYDAKKDKRFAEYLKDTKQDPNTASDAWLEARANYIARVKELEMSGTYKIYNQEGLLRYPYTPKETENLRNYADRIHGHTSAETKSQIERAGIGSLFMQFKAWALAKIRRYWTNQGLYQSEGFYEIKKDENGKPIEASFESLYMEGVLQTLWQIANDTVKYKSLIKAGKELTIEQKSNLVILISDLFILALISLLVNVWKNSEMSPLEARMNRAVGQGVSDLNIINTATMFITPQSALPAIDKAIKLIGNISGSLTGNDKAFDNLIKTPAVVRSFYDISNVAQ